MRSQKFTGPVNQNYLKSDVFGVQSTVWSPCGAEGMLNINSAVQITPLDSKKPALLTVSTASDLDNTTCCKLCQRLTGVFFAPI